MLNIFGTVVQLEFLGFEHLLKCVTREIPSVTDSFAVLLYIPVGDSFSFVSLSPSGRRTTCPTDSKDSQHFRPQSERGVWSCPAFAETTTY